MTALPLKGRRRRNRRIMKGLLPLERTYVPSPGDSSAQGINWKKGEATFKNGFFP
jgi:hypothetical protein